MLPREKVTETRTHEREGERERERRGERELRLEQAAAEIEDRYIRSRKDNMECSPGVA